LLHSLSYQSALARGYALVRDADGRMVRRAAGLLTGASISIEFADGQISAEVNGGTSGTSGPAPDPGVKRARPKSPPGSRGGQGSLF
ncbi:MAG: exodeoxyribonuclease VII large subunit, partial [Hyphomicrobium sp.]